MSNMRKLSELYGLVLEESISDDGEFGICTNIWYCGMSEEESLKCANHFKKGKHKLPMGHRKEQEFWFDSPEERIEYLKYLIELCKEQDI